MTQDFRPLAPRLPARVRCGVEGRWLLCLTGFLALALAGRAQEDPFYRGQRLSQYIRALRDADGDLRVKAAAALGGMRLPERSALAALASALQDPNAEVRRAAGSALATIGPAGVPYLVTALRHADPKVRAIAASSLGQLSSGDRAVIPPLIGALQDIEPCVRLEAAAALGHFGPAAGAAVPQLIEVLRGPGADLRAAAVGTLGNIGAPAQAAVGPLVQLLKEERRAGAVPRVREVVTALGQIGTAAGAAAPALAEILAEEDPGLRLRTAWALLAVGAEPATVVPVLTALLDDRKLARAKDGPSLQAQAADLLGWIGPEAEAAVPVLVRQMVRRDYPVGAAALKAVDRVGVAAVPELVRVFGRTPDRARDRLAFVLKRLGTPAVPPLARLLDHPQAEVRDAAAHVLGDIGRGAESAIPRLEESLDDPAMTVRLSAAEALLAVDRRLNWPALQLLARTLQDKDPAHRLRSLRIVEGVRPRLGLVAPALARMVLDPDDSISSMAWRALTRSDLRDPVVLQIARQALMSPEASRRPKAVTALDALAPEGIEVPTLIQALSDPAGEVRQAAAAALANRGPLAREALPALVTALKDPENSVWLNAVAALGRIGPAAAPALPALMAEWRNQESRAEVGKALRGIGQPALPLLLEVFRDPRRPDREQLARVLAETAVKAESAVITEPLQDPSVAVRREALEALKYAPGEFIRCFRPLLTEAALKDRDQEVRRLTVSALTRIPREAAPVLREVLRNPIVDIRLDAAQALILCPEYAAEAVPVFLEALKRHSESDVLRAGLGLCRLGPEAKAAVSVLRAALQAQEDAVRLWAALALGRIGPAAREAVPDLRRALHDGDPQVRLAAAHASCAIEGRPGAALPVLLEALRRGDRIDRPRVGQDVEPDEALCRYGPAAMPMLVRTLLGDGAAVRGAGSRTARLFGYLGPEAREAVPGLMAVLRQARTRMPPLGGWGSIATEGEVIRTLGRIGPGAGQAVPLLVEILTGKDSRLHADAAEALGRIGPAAAAAVPTLQAALQERESICKADLQNLNLTDPQKSSPMVFYHVMRLPFECWEFTHYAPTEWPYGSGVKAQAARALANIGPAAQSAIPALREALRSRPDHWFHLTEALWKLSGRADWVVPELIERLEESDEPDVEVFRLLADIGPAARDAGPALTAIVRRCLSRPAGAPDRGPLIPAIQALGWIGPAARAVVPDLDKALQGDEDDLRGAAAMALRRIDRRTEPAVPILVQLLRGEKPSPASLPQTNAVSPWVRVAAAEALGSIGGEAKEALPALRDVLQAEDSSLRVNAAVAVWQIEGNATASLPILLGALRDQDSFVRRETAETLGRLGPRAQAVVPALRTALEDERCAVRQAAAAALQKIRQDR